MRSRFFDFAHVLIGKPVPTFPGHALMEMIGGFGFAGSFRLRSKRSAPGYSCLAPWKDRGERSKSRCSSQVSGRISGVRQVILGCTAAWG